MLLRSLSLGASWVRGANQPLGLQVRDAACSAARSTSRIPEVDKNLNLEGTTFHQASIIGVDLEAKVVRSDWADVKVYADYDKMLDYDSGITLGSLLRFSFGQPATQALRARAELSDCSARPTCRATSTPSTTSSSTSTCRPATSAANGLTYYPTKLEFLEASRGGRRRIGGYVELTHAILDLLTVGAVVRGWTPYGDPGAAPAFVGPQFPDYGATCRPPATTAPQCDSKVALGQEPGFASLRLHAELPFRRFLQAFASYEVFSTDHRGRPGRLQVRRRQRGASSPARASCCCPSSSSRPRRRRYFFLQRLSNVDLKNLTFEQDQNFHSRWTFALNARSATSFDLSVGPCPIGSWPRPIPAARSIGTAGSSCERPNASGVAVIVAITDERPPGAGRAVPAGAGPDGDRAARGPGRR